MAADSSSDSCPDLSADLSADMSADLSAEHRELLALKAAAEKVAASSAEAFAPALKELLAALKDYQGRWPKPALVQIRHLVTLAAGLLGSKQLTEIAQSNGERQQAFRPLLVALSRVGQQATPHQEGLQQDRLQPAAAPFPLELVLVNLRSAFNVGSLVRTAECYGCAKVHVAGYTAGLDHPKVAAVAMGCERDMPWSHSPDPAALLTRLRQEGTTLVALETSPVAAPLPSFAMPFPAALIVGNERFGIEPDLLSHCAHIVRLPMFGKKNSLNVASACAIAIHHARSQWQNRP